MALLLNCDLGESFGAWTMGVDAEVMPHIDQANIACGFHAGDPMVMRATLALAKHHGVAVGAHPSYPDVAGFGRRSMQCSNDEIAALITYQLAALEGMARCQGLALSYIKPHGALYNDMMAKADIRHVIMDTVAAYHTPIHLMLQATPDAPMHQQEAEARGLQLYFEAFADRRYSASGLLLPRSQPGAVLTLEQMLAQVEQLDRAGTITTDSGLELPLQADTLCVHGDNPAAVRAIQAIRNIIHS
ncbi:MAG: 5-oxoprolinase subunit PxpA [Gammaproteobacteria bacterium]|uniref:5-oxoprolinase subunit PxpA n=1 Tax=Pseudomaricurvus alcaniphilus TaxID=1166482 RepID=UPI00140C8FA0|nr:5-oxoprolinase subunit PxpA [Pseudomaricurvus alcaniphilus]MBR9910808.1 5-oxoprolinase subunit PxpA [Gammaproteobacteria bacterium]NHN37314.1 5-oxoprolinase subunit PxpA [Pseudomaricurvus alcaniphilus]